MCWLGLWHLKDQIMLWGSLMYDLAECSKLSTRTFDRVGGHNAVAIQYNRPQLHDLYMNIFFSLKQTVYLIVLRHIIKQFKSKWYYLGCPFGPLWIASEMKRCHYNISESLNPYFNQLLNRNITVNEIFIDGSLNKKGGFILIHDSSDICNYCFSLDRIIIKYKNRRKNE